jgi:Cys-tRNA synthase (O-phospho-L-seryl-tRNA:Cys-tRNA synthase)
LRVHQTDPIQTGLVGAAAASEATTTERSFGATLAAAGKRDKSPKGEITKKVDGHDYVEVVAGPRNGMFINKSGNDRDGQAFVRKRGAEYDLHIYGTGADREIVKVPHKDAKPEQVQPVEGHPYAEITSGSRDGMFVNKTSNERSGEAFVLVKRADRDLHIYGSGKDRRVIVSWHKDREADKPEAVQDAKQDPKAETGGISAP